MDRAVVVRAARRWWYLIVLGTVLAAFAGYIVTSGRPDRYEATAHVLVGPVSGELDTVRSSGLLAQTYAELAITEERLEAVATELGLGLSADDLDEAVTVLANDTTRIVDVTATADDPGEAAQIANGVAGMLDSITAPDAWEGRTTVIDQASPPSADTGQPVLFLTVLAGLAGLVVSLALVLVLEQVPWRMRPVDAGTLVHGRFLGPARLQPLPRVAGLVAERRPGSRTAGDYRRIATKVSLLDPALRSLVVCGAASDAGSAEVAGNLAYSFARTNRHVALVDLAADPDLLRRLKVQRREREVQSIGGAVVEVVRLPVRAGSVTVVLSQDPTMEPAQDDTGNLVAALGREADLVVVHAPPALVEYATALVATQVDAVVLVRRDRGAAEAEAAEAAESLERFGARVMGMVVTVEWPARVDRQAQPLRRPDDETERATTSAPGEGTASTGAASTGAASTGAVSTGPPASPLPHR